MSSYITRKTPGDTTWFRHDRFGMFIHWGLYSMPARHEWIKFRERIPEDKYDKYFKYFNPDLYDPKEWARQAKAAGMKYVVMTAKHHEGFCMFDSQYTDYKCTNTPAGRDLLREYVDAFRAEGLRIGFYYSLIDWHHPDFTVDFNHPRRFDADSESLNQGRDMHRYAEYMRNQVTELLTNYGKIDILWFDFSYPGQSDPERPWIGGKGKDDWEAEKLIATVRSLQPHVIIDNRTGLDQDLWTPEQYQPQSWLRHKETGELLTWEACQTFSGSWGYHRDETSWKSPEMLIQMLVSTVSLGGNLLMNVGPTARGYLDSRAEHALKVYADWMKYNSRSIYGCTMAEPEFTAPNGCRFTQSEDGTRLYVHLFQYPFAFLELPGLAGKVDYAQFLHDGSELLYTENSVRHFSIGRTEADNLLVIELPAVKPDVVVPVIELFLK
ncbi:MAG: alpha-L-fucosidase [Lachnospiraceae bacterium]|nr:alpha-L-fucosidase [Lachnospiraceae bacterium]